MRDRKTYIGSSDAREILLGNWLELYNIKMGIVDPPDFSDNFKVQLGIHTEGFHAEWISDYGPEQLEPADFITHPDYPVLAASPDFRGITTKRIWELKHSHERADEDYLKSWYLPQVAHQCLVAGETEAYISVIRGNNEPEWYLWEMDENYILELTEMELQFWWHVDNGVPPELIPTAKLAQIRGEGEATLKVDSMRTVTMEGNNEWADAAITYSMHREGAQRFDEAKKALKKLVADDVRQASGHGIIIKRNKAGALRIMEDKT